METVFLNGEFASADDASISPFDRGFLFSDGVYEVIRSYGGRLFEADRHLDRLAGSLRELRIGFGGTRALGETCEDLLVRNGLAETDALVYLQITRGVAPRTHRFPDPAVPPTIFGYAWAHSSDHDPADGARAITVPDQRWSRCDIKSVGLLPNCLANQRAREGAALEAIFVRDGMALEGTHTNLFVASRGVVRTPPLNNYILAGVTRAVVLELAAEAGFETEELPISLDELRRADEVFVVGTTAEVTPITDLDGRAVGPGRPGDIALRLSELLRKRTREG